jgi:hypothetical protein
MPKGHVWSKQESLMLAKAYIMTSEDPINGVYQTAEEYHGRMLETYTKFCDEYNTMRERTISENTTRPFSEHISVSSPCHSRTAVAMANRLSKQNAGVQMFVNALSAARHVRSGGDERMLEDDVTREWYRLDAKEKYQKKTRDLLAKGKPAPPPFHYNPLESPVFELRSVWLYLKDKPKFIAYCSSKSTGPAIPHVPSPNDPTVDTRRVRGRDGSKIELAKTEKIAKCEKRRPTSALFTPRTIVSTTVPWIFSTHFRASHLRNGYPRSKTHIHHLEVPPDALSLLPIRLMIPQAPISRSFVANLRRSHRIKKAPVDHPQPQRVQSNFPCPPCIPRCLLSSLLLLTSIGRPPTRVQVPSPCPSRPHLHPPSS